MLVAGIAAAAFDSRADEPPARFVDVTEAVGIRTTATWKYGGPALADLNNDGRYDLALTNHHEEPAQLFLSAPGHRFVEAEPLLTGDVHGIAAGDYDGDGQVDLVISVGGGNGTSPKPPRILKNVGGKFEDVTESSGIAELGARGRAVRWADLDTDGDLDLLEINARQIPGETGPRNILFENVGGGRFEYRASPAFEDIEAERVLVTDLDGDDDVDLVTFTPLRILEGDDAFGFTDASDQWLVDLPDADREFAMAIAEADVDNDGDFDLYVARGKTYYEIANNSLELDDEGRMNLRDEGNAGQDSLRFVAGDRVGLVDFWHWPRGVDLTLPVFLGSDGRRIDTPATETPITAAEADGFPGEMRENGWYLGHLGDGEWRLGWRLNGDLAWGLRASVTGVKALKPEWEPQQLGVPDLLLLNEGERFVDASERLPPAAGDNNWGVITGDFDNDRDADFFVYRFGRLHGRVADVLLTNTDSRFQASIDHGASDLASGGHGDMGAPLDYDEDGWLDVLSGTDNSGRWNLYRNVTGDGSELRSLALQVGYAPSGVDAHGAIVTAEINGELQKRRVGSTGAVHSQGLNNLLHVGAGDAKSADTVTVRWRDGTVERLTDVATGESKLIGNESPQGELP